jgi:hypothetical protein
MKWKNIIECLCKHILKRIFFKSKQLVHKSLLFLWIVSKKKKLMSNYSFDNQSTNSLIVVSMSWIKSHIV